MKKAKSLYVMGSAIGLTKIGISDDPSARLRTIQAASGIRLSLVHSSDKTANARSIEAAAHKLLASKRKTGEWFDVTAEEAIEALADAAKLVEERRREKKRLGRPLIHGERLERVQVLITKDQSERLAAMADTSGRSISQVIRAYVDAGLKKDEGKTRK